MKRLFKVLPGLATIAVLSAISIFGQTRTENDRYLLRVHVSEQPDSPIRLIFDSVRGAGIGAAPVAVDDYYAKLPDTIMLRLENVSGSQVMAYALVSKGNAFHHVQINVFTKPMMPGDRLMRGFGLGESEEIEYSLDYRLFGDGRSWGPDRFHRSRQIARYFEGRNAALEQLKLLSTTYPDPQDFITRAYAFAVYLASDPAGEPDPKTLEMQYRRAWTEIIDLLRNNPSRQKESKQLADRLEAAIPSDR